MKANNIIGYVLIAISIVIGAFILKAAIIEAAGIIGSQISSALAIY